MPRIEQLEALLAKEPDDAFLNFGLAMELAKAGRFDESLRRFDRALATDPSYVAAHHHKGKTLIAMGDLDAAKRELEVGIRAAAEHGEAHSQAEMTELLDSL